MRQYYTNPRRVALEVALVVNKGQHPEEALNSLGCLLDQRDMRFATALTYGSLRHRLRLDRLIRDKVRKKEPPPEVREILRLGLVQLVLMDKVPAYAAVNETVNLAKEAAPRFAGLVNAVLGRFVAERKNAPCFPAETVRPEIPPETRLSIFYSHPAWLVEKLVRNLGFRETRSFLVASNQEAPPTLRVNPLKTDRGTLADKLGFATSPAAYSPWGLVPEGHSGRPDSWPGFSEGLFAVQDEASQILGLLSLEPKTILDGCAGLGGKSLALAALWPDARIVAVDLSAPRLSALEAEYDRLGLTGELTVVRGGLADLALPEAGRRAGKDEKEAGEGMKEADEGNKEAGEATKEPGRPTRRIRFVNIINDGGDDDGRSRPGGGKGPGARGVKAPAPKSPPASGRRVPEGLRGPGKSRADLNLPAGGFDLVVVDPPCSALGVIRRRPDVKWNKLPEDQPKARALQLELLAAGSRLAAPGGRLVYCVCTVLPEEAEDVVGEFLARNPGFSPVPAEKFPEEIRGLFTEPGYLRLWPQRHGTDGFFYAVLERAAGSVGGEGAAKSDL
ncbi:MAG: hypothetical protein LBO05_01585 [Deltaproteobacteria bacterium]|nr:hypothetical protein [Deltaproteobacteria bacterium]